MSTTAPGQRRLRSGIEGLDTILGGGFMLGGLYIVQGAPGAGKTILTNQICFHHARSGGKTMFVTLLAENHARMLGNLRSMSFFDDSSVGAGVTYLSAFAEMQQGGLAELTKLLRREIQRGRLSVLVIDGLVTAAASAPDEQAFKVFVHDLQELALATDCTMFLTTNAARAISPEQTMVDGLLVLSDRTYGWRSESDLQVTKFRGSAYLRGRHAYKISDQGFVAYPRIEALYARPTRPEPVERGRVASGNVRLDAMLGGGIPAASTTMMLGASGVGKTTFGLHFLACSTADEPGLLFGFYETPESIRTKSARLVPNLVPLFDGGVVEMVWQAPTDEPLDAYGTYLLEAVRRRGVKRLFIDGLTALCSGTVDASRVGNFISALTNELRVLGVTTFYSLEVQNIDGPVVRVPIDDVSRLAENMVLLRFVERGAHLHRVASVLKVRDSAFTPSLHEFEIGDHGVEIRATSESAQELLLTLSRGA